jgi:two-component system, LytTR family, response regulator
MGSSDIRRGENHVHGRVPSRFSPNGEAHPPIGGEIGPNGASAARREVKSCARGRSRVSYGRMMRALVVDDERVARDELERLLRETGVFEVVGKAADALEALKLLRSERPEVLFLDVQMPGVGGFELLGMIEDEVRPREVVFVTAHDGFAVEAFAKRALDYLLKPVQPERLAQTVAHLRARGVDASRPPTASADAAAPIKRIPCLAGKAVKLVQPDAVELVRSSDAGVYVVTAQGEYFTELTLAVLEARAGLVRCHRQYLVRLEHVDELCPGENSLAMVKTRSGHVVPVSRRHLAQLRVDLGLE